ncbi:MAG: hypothetical protein UT63_C0055G0007 [Candidatus Gottesmanbacteria bacterium GW2011_GWC2_39_8]|uniref:Uncharacterized protein n=1 Tax=Candidatus Gottesmanbacteria bacterium GW2011_GWC2_39_8 TaxID=1618450 RepID=A0A0G0PUY4_9BACT|nr:MAG: hypothetical protein UT63_C0055G0007 [Candidatus Gottesmanbacteria bacterium GW2011_GWC2_39_8]
MITQIQKKLRKISRRFTLSKREQFVGVSLILTLGLVIIQNINYEARILNGIILSLLTYLLSAFVLRDDLNGIEWVSLFILPTLFTITTVLFYFLLPGRWLTRLPTDVAYAVGIYAILLTENIYNVAAERSIQLLRAAQSVGFLITLIVLFLFSNIILSLHLSVLANFSLISLVSLLLSFQSLWSIRLSSKADSTLILYSVFISLGVGEMAAVLSFWPAKTTIASLFITAMFYTMVGVIQYLFQGRLFKGTTKEFLIVLFFIIIMVFMTTSWSG